jgi:hypothetical protein
LLDLIREPEYHKGRYQSQGDSDGCNKLPFCSDSNRTVVIAPGPQVAAFL